MANEEIVKDEFSFERSDKVLLYGSGGTGKSFSTATMLINPPKDRRLIYLMTERNAVSGLERGLKHYDIKVEKNQLIYVFPKQKTKAFTNLNRALGKFTKESKVDALKGKATTTEGKEHYTYLQDIINKLENFSGIDFATKEEIKLGNVGNLNKEDILIIDGLSPIGSEVWKSTVGDKIAIGMTDYLPAQNLMYLILSELSILSCPVVLLAHEKEITDDKGNILKINVNTWVGNANYESLMGLFTDVIRAVSTPTGFKWEIDGAKSYTISRRIPKGNLRTIEPNFSKYEFFK